MTTTATTKTEIITDCYLTVLNERGLRENISCSSREDLEEMVDHVLKMQARGQSVRITGTTIITTIMDA